MKEDPKGPTGKKVAPVYQRKQHAKRNNTTKALSSRCLRPGARSGFGLAPSEETQQRRLHTCGSGEILEGHQAPSFWALHLEKNTTTTKNIGQKLHGAGPPFCGSNLGAQEKRENRKQDALISCFLVTPR